MPAHLAVKRYNSSNPILKGPEDFISMEVLKEIQLLKYFKHENIIKLFDVIVAESETKNDDNVVICIEPMDTDLKKIVGKIDDLYEAAIILYQVLRALKYLHFCGIAHRCLSLSNILINVDTLEVKLCDFQKAEPAIIKTIQEDISTVFDGLERVFGNLVNNDQKYKQYKARQLTTSNILLNSSFFCELDLYNAELDEPNQIYHKSPFDWNQLDLQNVENIQNVENSDFKSQLIKNPAIVDSSQVCTIVHLISMESREHDKQKEISQKTNRDLITSDDRAFACELEHGVQCGDIFSPSRMRFENAKFCAGSVDEYGGGGSASYSDLQNSDMHNSVTSLSTYSLSSNQIFEDMFGGYDEKQKKNMKKVCCFKPIEDPIEEVKAGFDQEFDRFLRRRSTLKLEDHLPENENLEKTSENETIQKNSTKVNSNSSKQNSIQISTKTENVDNICAEFENINLQKTNNSNSYCSGIHSMQSSARMTPASPCMKSSYSFLQEIGCVETKTDGIPCSIEFDSYGDFGYQNVCGDWLDSFDKQEKD